MSKTTFDVYWFCMWIYGLIYVDYSIISLSQNELAKTFTFWQLLQCTTQSTQLHPQDAYRHV